MGDAYLTGLRIKEQEPYQEPYIVRYIDYDGTILKEVTVTGGNVEPPEPATHLNLSFTGWTASASNIDRDMVIGAKYEVTDGKSYFKIKLDTNTGLMPTLYLTKTDESHLTIVWGDGNTDIVTTSGSFSISHTYSTAGEYIISMFISEGEGKYSIGSTWENDTFTFLGTTTSTYLPSLREVYLGENVIGIEKYSFYGCSNLQNIMIPTSVSNIGMAAFATCRSLKTLILPNITGIPMGIAYFCSLLENLVIPDTVQNIEQGAFGNTYNLEILYLPDSINIIGDHAFASSGIKNLYISNNITSIGNNSFDNCKVLNYLEIRANNITLGNECFFKCLNLEKIKIINGQIVTGESTFEWCVALKTIEMLNNSSFTYLGENSFNTCYNLSSIDISSVEQINDGVFANCYSLKSINLSSELISIGTQAFQSAGITMIDIPATVTNIGSAAFNFCDKLNLVICRATSPPSTSESLFYQSDYPLRIYVPDNSINAYLADPNWGYYSANIFPISLYESN